MGRRVHPWAGALCPITPPFLISISWAEHQWAVVLHSFLYQPVLANCMYDVYKIGYACAIRSKGRHNLCVCARDGYGNGNVINYLLCMLFYY